MRDLLESGRTELPDPKLLPCSDIAVPYHFVSDEAFPLKRYMMKPYPRSRGPLSNEKLVFNYRLSRARRIVGGLLDVLTCFIAFYLYLL